MTEYINTKGVVNCTLINYADGKYSKTQHFNTKTALNYGGFNKVIEYGPEDIDIAFKSEHKDVFSYRRGNGLWLWKPYLIYKTLLTMPNGALLFYCDSGSFWIKSAMPIISILEKDDIFVSCVPFPEKQFTKKICFDVLGVDYTKGDNCQYQGTFIGIKKTKTTLEFVKEWLACCSDFRLIAPDYENIGIDDTYIAHREDQSLLSLICQKHNIKGHTDPSQYGRIPDLYKRYSRLYTAPDIKREYKTMLILHRTPNVKFFICFKQLMLTLLPVYICRWYLNRKSVN